MAVPTEIDFAIVKMGDGADPEVFTIICGLQDVSLNKGANTTDRFVRDCANPGRVPTRKVRVTGKQLEITGSGLTNKAEVARLEAALGKVKNYRVEGYIDDGTDTGELAVTYDGAFVLTADNMSATREGDSTGEITLANHGDWTITVAA